MKKLTIILVIMFFLGITSNAQEFLGGITYQVSFPTGETKDFIERASWWGFGVEARKIIRPNFTVGFSLNWNNFAEDVEIEPEASIPEGKYIQKRTIKSYPILLTSHLYLGDEEGLRAYLGIGAGAYAIRKINDSALAIVTESNWHFGIAPELGVIFKAAEGAGIMVSVKYNYAFEAGSSSHSYWTMNLGFLWIN
jgi:outer membrane protein W